MITGARTKQNYAFYNYIVGTYDMECKEKKLSLQKFYIGSECCDAGIFSSLMLQLCF